MDTAEGVGPAAGGPRVGAQFQFGPTLPKGPRGQVDAGLGKVTSRGTVTLIPPTPTIEQPIEVHRIDGIQIVFQFTPETEAPAEMHSFHPALGVLNLAETRPTTCTTSIRSGARRRATRMRGRAT